MSQGNFASPDGRPNVQSNGLGLAGFIVSLVGLLACGGLICPVGAIMSAFALKREPRGFAIAGLILGLIGSAWMIVAVFVIGLGAIAAAIGLGAALYAGEVALDANSIREAINTQVAAGETAPAALDDVKGIKEEWKTDKWGHAYHFTLADDKKSFTLVSDGPDGKPSTLDDIKLEFDLR